MTSTAQLPDLLEAIVASTRRTLTSRAAAVSIGDVEQRASTVAARPGAFKTALSRTGRYNVIAECKRRSPSRGVLCADYDPATLARSYEKAGAAALSVLTEPAFFDGSLDHLAAARSVSSLPILRKDFIVDPYQIFEARAAGADAVLLIVAALSGPVLAQLHATAVAAGLDVLVEVHDLEEIPAALDAGASIIGVNNRNLRTLNVDVDVSRKAIDLIPEDVIAVAESGLKASDDLRRLRESGYDAFLIGERFMATADPGAALAELLGGIRE